MKTINKDTLRLLREEINEAVNSVAEKHGIKIHAGNATYSHSGTNATFKLEVAIEKDGEVIDKDAQSFLDYATLLGLEPEMLFKQFKAYGKTYKLVGYSPRAQKYPFLAERDGKRYKLPKDAVKAETFN
jgi:cell division ATPase FtsA